MLPVLATFTDVDFNISWNAVSTSTLINLFLPILATFELSELPKLATPKVVEIGNFQSCQNGLFWNAVSSSFSLTSISRLMKGMGFIYRGVYNH